MHNRGTRIIKNHMRSNFNRHIRQPHGIVGQARECAPLHANILVFFFINSVVMKFVYWEMNEKL